MGIFKKIGNGLKEIGRGIENGRRYINRKVGEAIEKIGSITKIDFIETIGIDIQLNNPYLEKAVDVDAEGDYKDLIDANALIEDIRAEAKKKGRVLENKMVDELRSDIDKYIDCLSEIFDDNTVIELGYEIENSFEDDIHNTFSGYISDNISVDSERFIEILKIQEDSEREIQAALYRDECVNKGITLLKEKCQNKKIEICRDMLKTVKRFLDEERSIAEEKKRKYTELQKKIEDSEYRKKESISTLIDLTLFECIQSLTYENINIRKG